MRNDIVSSKTGIVLNRMYSGSYLTTNLGHEVINLFAADNGHHYLYLNARGNVVDNGLLVQHMLLVIYIGNNQVEVVGLAKNICIVESATVSLSKELDDPHGEIAERQKQFIKQEGITYGGVPLHIIFNDAEQQSVFVSYKTGAFYKPKKKIILEYGEKMLLQEKFEQDIEDNPNGFAPEAYLSSHKFSSTSLHQFIMSSDEGDDYDKLEKIIENDTLWEQSNEKVPTDSIETREPSLFEICDIQCNENVFSNALCYYIKKYPEYWRGLFYDKRLISVRREVDAKVNENGWKEKTGGRIDLFIEDEESYIVIENKIKSGINRIASDKEEENQLTRYENYVNYLKSKNKRDNSHLMILCPDYNQPSLPKKTYWEIITYSKVCTHLDQRINEMDSGFKAFFFAMKRHSYSTLCESLYEDMKNTLCNRILSCCSSMTE